MSSRVSLSTFVAICAIAAFARAEPTAADLVTARKLYNEALDLEDAGNLQGALTKLVAADALVASPKVRLELGKVHLRLGHLVDAYHAFSSLKGIAPDPKNEAKYSAARSEAASLAISTRERIPGLRVNVQGLSPGELTSATIDDVVVPTAALGESRLVDPGHHVVVVRATRGGTIEERRVDLDLAEKDDRVAEVVFEPLPKAAPPSPPPVAASPPSIPAPVRRDEAAPLPTVFWVSSFTAGAALIAGGVTGAITLSRGASLRARCDPKCPPELEGELNGARTLGAISTVSFAVAGVFTGVAIVSWVTRPTTERHVSPVVGLGWLGVEGRF